ncbi:MAG: hypothetical protein QXU97_01450 [Fervidicoccaceae archaeon]
MYASETEEASDELTMEEETVPGEVEEEEIGEGELSPEELSKFLRVLELIKAALRGALDPSILTEIYSTLEVEDATREATRRRRERRKARK